MSEIDGVNICVFSLSEDGDLLSQWRAYCPPSGGYAIGFDSSALRQIGGAEGFDLGACVYDPTEQNILLREGLANVLLNLPDPSPRGIMVRTLRDGLEPRFLRQAAYLKHRPASLQRLPNAMDVYWLPWSE